MTSNKEFISQTEEILAKMGAAKAPQFNLEEESFRKLLGTKKDEMSHLSIACTTLNAQILDGKNSITVNNPTDVGKKSITLKH